MQQLDRAAAHHDVVVPLPAFVVDFGDAMHAAHASRGERAAETQRMSLWRNRSTWPHKNRRISVRWWKGLLQLVTCSHKN